MEHKIGDFKLDDKAIVINKGKRFCDITVRNEGRRMIQVGSHFHFFEVNRDLTFDRDSSFGMHLDIPSGTAVRWLPGEEKTVSLTEYGGKRQIFGFNELTNGCLNDPEINEAALVKARRLGFIKGGVKNE